MKNNIIYVLDLDRTLIDTDEFIKMLAVSLDLQGYDGDALVEMIEKALTSEQDINAKAAIDSLGEGAWSSVKSYFSEESQKHKLVFDDARIFLEKLKSAGLPHIILTFGISKEWQNLKLQTTGLDYIPTIITATRDKSKIINSWKDNHGVYVPPGFPDMSASNIVLVDDRPNAFLHPTENLKGYLLDRPMELGHDFKTPQNVRIINTLAALEI